MNRQLESKTRTALGAAIVAACALVTSLGVGVGVAVAAPTAPPAEAVAAAPVAGCRAGWSVVPLPVEIDGIERSRCWRGGEVAVERNDGGAGYSRGDGRVRWTGTVTVPAGRHVAMLYGGGAHSIAMIDGAVIAPAGLAGDGVKGPRRVILTGPETVKAQVNWSGIRAPWLMIEPVLGASR